LALQGLVQASHKLLKESISKVISRSSRTDNEDAVMTVHRLL